MHKVVIHRAGHYDQLQLETHASPPLPPAHVRIAVEACGVNYADCIVRMGLYASAKAYVGWPITPGFEVAGRVMALGDGVEGLNVGDDVVAVTRFGGYCDELVVASHQVYVRPPGLSAIDAAAMPSVFLTAWYGLIELAQPPSGTSVLIHSAAGGGGQALVQLALRRGCKVVGIVGGAHKVDSVRALGPVDVIDKSADRDWWAEVARCAPSGYAAVFDANGVATLRRSYKQLAARGTLVIYGFATMLPRGGRRVRWLRLALDYLRTPRFDPLHLTQHNHNVMGFNLSYLFDNEALLVGAMETLLSWMSDGTITPPPVQTFALADAAQAHRAIETGTTVGKLVLTTEHAA